MQQIHGPNSDACMPSWHSTLSHLRWPQSSACPALNANAPSASLTPTLSSPASSSGLLTTTIPCQLALPEDECATELKPSTVFLLVHGPYSYSFIISQQALCMRSVDPIPIDMRLSSHRCRHREPCMPYANKLSLLCSILLIMACIGFTLKSKIFLRFSITSNFWAHT
jgi:hypothetical protein